MRASRRREARPIAIGESAPVLIRLPASTAARRRPRMNDTMARLRVQWNDPLLTALTVLLAVMLFVIAPLQASGIFLFQAFEFFFAIILIAGVFVMSGSRMAGIAMLVALVMATTGGIFRLTAPSILDLRLFAGAWLIMGITM